jgi:hypothetical protein
MGKMRRNNVAQRVSLAATAASQTKPVCPDVTFLHTAFDTHPRCTCCSPGRYQRDRVVAGTRKPENHVHVCRSRFGDERTGTGQTSGTRYEGTPVSRSRFPAPVLEIAVIMQSSRAGLMLLTQAASRSRQRTVHKRTLVIMAELRPPNNANSLIYNGRFVVILGDGSNGIRN